MILTAEGVVGAIVELVKLINFYNANLTPEEAHIQTARLARVLDFLFGWLDRHQVQSVGTPVIIPPTLTNPGSGLK